jgi:hypothetical protein
MKMSNGTKFNIFLVLWSIGLGTCNYFKPKEKKDEVVIDKIHIDKQVCVPQHGRTGSTIVGFPLNV